MWVNDVGFVYFFMISSSSPGVNLHVEKAWCMTGVTLNCFFCVLHVSKNEAKGTVCELQSQALGTQDVTLCCVHSLSGFWFYFIFAFFLKPPSHKAHGMRSACATSSLSIFSFIRPVELQALFHSELLNHRDFQLLFHFRGVRVLWRYEWFHLCLSHMWGGNNPGALPLLPKEFNVQILRLKASIDLGYPMWDSCNVS